jgi:hypothetical protein
MPTNVTIQDLYPDLSDQELAEAEHDLDRYLSLVLRIFERIELEERASTLTSSNSTLSCTPTGFSNELPSCRNTSDT